MLQQVQRAMSASMADPEGHRGTSHTDVRRQIFTETPAPAWFCDMRLNVRLGLGDLGEHEGLNVCHRGKHFLAQAFEYLYRSIGGPLRNMRQTVGNPAGETAFNFSVSE